MSLSSLVRKMAWRQFGANPFLEPMLTLHREEAKEQSLVKYIHTLFFYKQHIYKQRGLKSDFAKQLSPQISPT